MGYSPRGHKELDMTEATQHIHILHLVKSPLRYHQDKHYYLASPDCGIFRLIKIVPLLIILVNFIIISLFIKKSFKHKEKHPFCNIYNFTYFVKKK